MSADRGCPAPLASVTLKAKQEIHQLEGNHKFLRLSAFKRRMVGMRIIIGGKAETEISLPSFDLSGRVNKTRDDLFEIVDFRTIGTRSSRQEQPCVVMPSTAITIVEISTLPAPNNRGTISGDILPDLSPTAKYIGQAIWCVRRRARVSRAFLISGPPGVGKTFAVKQAVKSSQKDGPTRVFSLRGSELFADANGEPSEAAQILCNQFELASRWSSRSRRREKDEKEENVAVIFLDECDALLSENPVAAMLGTLLDKIWEGDETFGSAWNRIVFVSATNRIDSIPLSLRRSGRLDREITMGPPRADERARILSTLLREATRPTRTDGVTLQRIPLSCECSDEDLVRVADLCVGFVAADLNSLVRQSILNAVSGGCGTMCVQHIESAMETVDASVLRDAVLTAPPTVEWEDIGGDVGGAKTALRQAIEWPFTRRNSYKKLGLVPPRGVTMSGPPGCGKSSLARAAAGASGVAFLSLSPADVYSSSYVGEAEAVIRRVFALARSAAPCILFFDEIDSIFGGNGGDGEISGRGNSAEARVLSTFLNEMDGVDGTTKDGVLVLGATNRPWALDAALMRPGRLGDKTIYVPAPDFASRKAIFELQTRYWDLKEPLDLDYLASEDLSKNMTGAEVVSACQAAFTRVVRDKTTSHQDYQTSVIVQSYLVDELKKVTPLLSDSEKAKEFRISIATHD